MVSSDVALHVGGVRVARIHEVGARRVPVRNTVFHAYTACKAQTWCVRMVRLEDTVVDPESR